MIVFGKIWLAKSRILLTAGYKRGNKWGQAVCWQKVAGAVKLSATRGLHHAHSMVTELTMGPSSLLGKISQFLFAEVRVHLMSLADDKYMASIGATDVVVSGMMQALAKPMATEVAMRGRQCCLVTSSQASKMHTQ